MVLGMHDALVELSGIIAGMTFAVSGNRLIVMTGIIAAAAASLSMAAANYMAQRADGRADAFVCAMYTGAMYIATSLCLILPFCIIHNRFWALGMMGIVAVAIIFIFNLCAGGAQSYWRRTLEMLAVCSGVATASFIIGQLARNFLGVNI